MAMAPVQAKIILILTFSLLLNAPLLKKILNALAVRMITSANLCCCGRINAQYTFGSIFYNNMQNDLNWEVRTYGYPKIILYIHMLLD